MSAPHTDNGLRPGTVQGPALSDRSDRSRHFLRYFGFRESPFGVTPDPAFLFSSRMHRAALQSMIDSIESNLGFTVLMGDPGMGKTTLLLQLLSQYGDRARTALVFHTQCRRHELLRYLAADLGLDIAKGDEVSLHQRLEEMLVNEARAGRKVLILIDEAQNLHHSSLEAVRLLSDFETPTAKLLHVILAGSLRLGEKLVKPELSQLAQRVPTICRLNALAPEEVEGYIRFRLRVAGCRVADTLFSPEALSEVAKESKGVPRVINSVCHRALYVAYTMGAPDISAMLVQQAAKDLDLAHSPDINESFLSLYTRIRKPAGSSVLPDLVISEDKHPYPEPEAALGKASSAEMPEISAHITEMQFQTPGISSSPDSAKQPPARTEKEFVAAREARNSASRPRRVNRDLGFQHSALASGRLRYDRFTVVLAVLSIILIALGSWIIWGKLYSQRVAHQAANTKFISPEDADRRPVSPESKDRLADLRAQQLDTLMAPVELSSNTADRKPRPNAPIVQTLPNTPSRIRSTANSSEELPSTNITVPAESSKISLTSVPLPLPTLEATVPHATKATDAHPNTDISVDGGSDVQQASFPHPIKIVEPEYPSLAKLRHVEGEVLLQLQIDSTGKVRDARAISGNILLREAAQEAARQWQYAPRSAGDGPIPTVTWVQIKFKLNSDVKR